MIRIRATQHGISIVCDPDASFTDLAQAIRLRLQSNAQFYKNADIKLNVGDRPIGPGDLDPIRAILEGEFQLRLSGVVCSQENLMKRFEQEIGCPVEFLSSDQPAGRAGEGARSDMPEAKPPEPVFRFDDGLEEAMIVRQTCRSGMKLSSPGVMVILGNVNPGAEVIAGRDIIVLGVLRGNAHAGASGDTAAVIIALGFEPKQLRIADHLGLPPSAEKSPDRSGTAVSPEIAFVEGSQIVVEAYTGRFPGA